MSMIAISSTFNKHKNLKTC